jgi:hypothetical protein
VCRPGIFVRNSSVFNSDGTRVCARYLYKPKIFSERQACLYVSTGINSVHRRGIAAQGCVKSETPRHIPTGPRSYTLIRQTS